VDEFFAQSKVSKCQSLKESAELIAKVGFKMFLGITANVGKWSPDEKEFSLILDENPLTEFVDLPENCSNLLYSNMLCGVIRGAMEMAQIKVACKFISDALRPGEDVTEIRVYFKEFLSEAVPVNDE
jgi:trafficking protein particle complex subunit 3